MMRDLKTGLKVERLPIVATKKDTECVLKVPAPGGSTGKAIAVAVHKCLEEFDLLDVIQAICFDTENANTGNKKGAAAWLEKHLLKRTLLWLACRHHIFEIILRDVFIEIVMESKTSQPDTELFKILKDSWENDIIKKDEFVAGIEDEDVAQYFDDDFRNEMLKFCSEHLQKKYRDDYREFLELVVIFLGGQIQGGNRLRKPGAMHHARWMSKAIYSLKFFMLRDQFEFDDEVLENLRTVCIFLVRLYVKAWFNCPSAIIAARHDLNFIKESIDYSSVNEQISEIILKKISNHTWYLGPEQMGFSFFDENIPIEEKKENGICFARQ